MNVDFKFGPGDVRKTLIILLFGGVVYLRASGQLVGQFYWLLGMVGMFYAMDVFYTLAVSPRSSSQLKAFIFQTAVPIFALTVTFAIASTGVLESSAVVTMFGLSLAYTTFIVGRRIRDDVTDDDDTP